MCKKPLRLAAFIRQADSITVPAIRLWISYCIWLSGGYCDDVLGSLGFANGWQYVGAILSRLLLQPGVAIVSEAHWVARLR